MNGRRAILLAQWQKEFNVDLGMVKDIFKAELIGTQSMYKKNFIRALESHPSLLAKRANLRALRERLLLIQNVLSQKKTPETLIKDHEHDILTFEHVVNILTQIASPVIMTFPKEIPPPTFWCVKKQTFRHFNYRKRKAQHQKRKKRLACIHVIATDYAQQVIQVGLQRSVEKIWLNTCSSEVNTQDLFQELRPETTASKKRTPGSRQKSSRRQTRPGTQSPSMVAKLNQLRVELLMPTIEPKDVFTLMNDTPHLVKSYAFIALAEARGDMQYAREIIHRKGMMILFRMTSKSVRESRVGKLTSWDYLKIWNEQYRKKGIIASRDS